jgi:glycosyltransferase involved in cell wall biosynthesis
VNARTVQQVIATAAPYDAVTGQALLLDGLLREWGYRSEVYAENVHPDLADRVRPLARRVSEAAAVLLRYSIWSRAVEDVLARPPRRLGVIYHNVTPPEMLAAVNPRVAELCRTARRRLADLAVRTDVALADSNFNADDMRAAGFARVSVVPLVLPLPASRETDPPAREPLVLTIGRVVPNKRLELVLRAFALMRATGSPGAELALVGSWDGFERYRDALARFAGHLGVGGVRFLGRVDDPTRDALVARAGVYVCASAHEGFCAPLVEAMAAGLPVVAVRGSAVTETVGAGGLLLPDPDPSDLAEAMRRVLDDPATAGALAHRARARAADFAPDAVTRRLRTALAPLLGDVA